MKRKIIISRPEQLNDHLKATGPITWIMLGVIILSLVAIIIWANIAKIEYKVEGNAIVSSGLISLEVEEKYLSDIEVGQTVIIDGEEGVVTSIDDGIILVSITGLDDGEYRYKIVTKEIHPINYLIDR